MLLRYCTVCGWRALLTVFPSRKISTHHTHTHVESHPTSAVDIIFRLEAKIPVRRRRSQTPASFLDFAKPRPPQRSQSAGATTSLRPPGKMSRRDQLLLRVNSAALVQKPKLGGGQRFVPKNKNGTLKAITLLEHSAGGNLTLTERGCIDAPGDHGFATIKTKHLATQTAAKSFGGMHKSNRHKMLQSARKRVNTDRTKKANDMLQNQMDDEEEGYATYDALTSLAAPAAVGDVADEELDEEDLFDNEGGEDDMEEGLEGADQDADESADEGAENAPDEKAAAAGDNSDEDDELSQITETARKQSSSTPPPGDVFKDAHGKEQQAVDPAAFFGAKTKSTSSSAEVTAVKRRFSGGEGEPVRIMTPLTISADGRPATPVFGTPNHRNQTPELFGSGTPQSFSPFVAEVNCPHPDRRGSQITYGRTASSSSTNAIRTPIEDSEDVYGTEDRTPANQPRSLTSAFTPVNSRDEEESYLDENGFMVKSATQASVASPPAQRGRVVDSSRFHVDSDEETEEAEAQDNASQQTQSFDAGWSQGDGDGMSQLVEMCSGVFESQADTGAVNADESQETAKESSESFLDDAADEDDDIEAANDTIVEEEEEANAHGFVVEEADVSGDSEEEDEEGNSQQDVEDLLDDGDDDEELSAGEGPAFLDDDDDDEIARLKARFVHEADEDELEDAAKKAKKKEMKDMSEREQAKEERRLRRENKKARRERKRLKKEAKKKAAAEAVGSADGAGPDSVSRQGTDESLKNLFADESEAESSDDEVAQARMAKRFQKNEYWATVQKADSESQLAAFGEDSMHVQSMIRNTYSTSNSVPFGVRRTSSSTTSIPEDSVGNNSNSKRSNSSSSRAGVSAAAMSMCRDVFDSRVCTLARVLMCVCTQQLSCPNPFFIRCLSLFAPLAEGSASRGFTGRISNSPSQKKPMVRSCLFNMLLGVGWFCVASTDYR